MKLRTNNSYGIDLYKQHEKSWIANKITVKCADITNGIPFADNMCDVVVCNQVIEHLPDPDYLIQEIYRVLKKDGYLILSTVNLASLHSRLMLLLGMQPSCYNPSLIPLRKATTSCTGKTHYGIRYDEKSKYERHISCFTVDAIKRFMEYYQFRVVDITSQPLYFIPAALSKVICRLIPTLGAYITIKAIPLSISK